MTRPVIHIGFQKTGSTWLQSQVFEVTPGLFNVDRTGIEQVLIDPGPLRFDASEAKRLLAGVDPDTDVVLSHEWLAGHPDGNGYDAEVFANRLRQLFDGECCVLIVIRRQADALRSLYGEWVSHGGATGFSRFVSTPDDLLWHPAFRLNHFEYDRVISLYQDTFGVENVVVLPYELLANDPIAFVERCRRETGVADLVMADNSPAHRSFSDASLRTLRYLNKVVSEIDRNPAALVISKGAHDRLARALRKVDALIPRSLSDRRRATAASRSKKAVAGKFADSNQRTVALTGLDLAQWGYEL